MPISASPLAFDWNGTRAIKRTSIDLRDDFRVSLSIRHDRYATADIRAFFHSIYTHAIPWAIYGKDWSKTNRSIRHFGNLLDLYCRNAQDGQTIGLPVGPDTSRVIAEIIASAIDKDILDSIKISNFDASRYIDDYSIAIPPTNSGHSIISAIRQATAKFELELNNDKSAVQLTSYRPASGWKQIINSHVPRADKSTDAFLKFFYEIGRICNENPGLNVEKFAFQSARSSFINANDWTEIQSLLINAYRRNSSLISIFVEFLILRDIEHNDLEKDVIRDFVESYIPSLVEENRSGELIWILFLVIRIDLQLSASKVQSLFKLENAMVALLVTYALKNENITGPVDQSIWANYLNEDGLQSQMWLYSYESIRNGTNQLASNDFIKNHPFFKFLLAKNVRFFDPSVGFKSTASTLRSRRGENAKIEKLRSEFRDRSRLNLIKFGEDDDPFFDENDPFFDDDDDVFDFDDNIY